MAAEYGLKEGEFLEMTPRQFHAWRKGHRRPAELARAVAFLVAGHKLPPNMTIRKFWPLPWDIVPKIEPIPQEQIKFIEDNARRLFESLERGNNSTT